MRDVFFFSQMGAVCWMSARLLCLVFPPSAKSFHHPNAGGQARKNPAHGLKNEDVFTKSTHTHMAAHYKGDSPTVMFASVQKSNTHTIYAHKYGNTPCGAILCTLHGIFTVVRGGRWLGGFCAPSIVYEGRMESPSGTMADRIILDDPLFEAKCGERLPHSYKLYNIDCNRKCEHKIRNYRQLIQILRGTQIELI